MPYVFALIAFALTATSAIANCGPVADMHAQLAERYGERRYVAGVGNSGGAPVLIEFWGNTETGSWTATRTTAAGVMCVLATGGNFYVVSAPIPGTDS